MFKNDNVVKLLKRIQKVQKVVQTSFSKIALGEDFVLTRIR